MRLTVLGRGLTAVLAVLAACSQSPSQRVRVTAEVAQRLVAHGGKVVGDYGSFQVVETDARALSALSPGEATVLDGRILLNAGAVDPEVARNLPARTLAVPAKGRALNLVQFAGPVRPEWHDALLATGVRVVTYIPNDAYLVWGDAASLTALTGMSRSSAAVRWIGAYLDSDKIDPAVRTADTGAWSIQLVEDEDANALTMVAVALLEQKPTLVSRELGYVNLVVHCDAAAAASLSVQPDVVSIQPWFEPKMNDERQAMIVSGNISGNGPSAPGYLAWLASKGFTQAQFTTSGFGVDVSDSGLDNGTVTPNHFGLYALGSVANSSRVSYARIEGSGTTAQGCDGHGTINAHIVAGYASLSDAIHADASGYRYGMGIAPFVKVGSSVIFAPSWTSPDYEDLQSRAWNDGMRISTNSWGYTSGNTYTADCQRYDALVRDAAPAGSALPVAGNQEMAIVFSAGNNGPSANTVAPIGTAKNVITVGATEGVQPFGVADGCGVVDSNADSFNDIISFSSRGPTADGRRKPDLVAPGSHISGGVAQADGQRADPPAVAGGDAITCFDASGVCALSTGSFFPVGQEWYTVSSGTSHSAPAVAGAAALVRQYFVNQGWGTPSPAMIKAYLMNSGRYLTGVSANDTLWSNAQGMGFLDLGMAFDGVGRALVDQEPANLFTGSGQTFTLDGYVATGSGPFRVTLAWTDAPGATTGAAWKNDLNLTVTVGGNTYLGNVFTGATSVTGGSADAANNVESVFLPAGLSGPFTVTVTAANINSDGVPGNAEALDQDFALVVHGACTSPPPATPTGVTATATASNEVTVDWTPVDGATEYRVYRGTSAGGPYTRVGIVAAPPFADATVSGGTTYYYVVRAVICAESPDSAEVSATATGDCTTPPTFAGASSAASNSAASCGNTVTWSAAAPSCGGTLSYSVYRGTSGGFTPGVANRIATGLTGTSFSDDLNLQTGTTYHYVVRAVEIADVTIEEANAVERDAGTHGAVGSDYFDDFDASRPANAAAYWIPITDSGTAGTANLTDGCRYQSATHSYRVGGQTSAACLGTYPLNTVGTLSLGGDGSVAGVQGFSVATGGTLSFNQWYSLESRYDGTWLVYSTSGPTGPWVNVPDSVTASHPYITSGAYDNTLYSNTSIRIWTGDRIPANGSLRQVTVNLDAVAGRAVWFGWKFYSDTSVVREGFYVDDVRVTSVYGACTTNVPPPGPAASFAVSLPASTGAGDAAALTVTALDAVGLTATSYVGTAAVTSSDPQAVLPAPITFSAGVGTASVELRTLGAQTVTVTDQAAPEVTGSGATSVTPGTPASLGFGVQPGDVVAGVAIAPAVTVRILDAFGNLTTATDPVTLALGANPGGDTLGGTLTVNAVAGVATFPGLVLDVAAAGYTLTATSGGLTGATSSSFAVLPAAATQLTITLDASDAVAGEAIAPSPQVAIRDAFGNLTGSTATVSVALAANAYSAALGGTLSVAASGGVATFSDLWVDKVGDGYQLVFSSGGLTGATGSGFSITHAASDHVVFVQQPTDLVAGDTFAPAVSVAVLDRFDNLATGHVGNVTLGVAVNPSAASLVGTTTETVISGVASFANVSIQAAGTYYRLSAAADLLTGAVSDPFHVSPGTVSQLLFATQPGGSVAGAAIPGPTSVHLVDAYGNRQPDAVDPVTISLGSNPGGDTLGGTLTVNAVAGAATFADLVLDRAADGYTLVAASGGLVAESAGFDVHPAAPASLEFMAAPAAVSAAHAPLDPIPAVRIRDAFNNTVTSSSLTVSIALGTNPSSGTLAGATATAAVAGVATFPGLSIDAMGSGYTLVASRAGLTSATSTSFDIAAGQPASLAFVSQPATVQAGATLPSITVEIRDAWGNRTTATSEVLLGFATAPGGATLSGTRRVAAVAGSATFSDLSVDKVGTGLTLSATVAGLPAAVTTAFDVTPGPVAQLVFAAQPGSSAAGGSIAGPPAVRLYDAFGNATTSTNAVTVALGANPGGDTLGGTLTVNAVAGLATFNGLVLDSAATGYTLTATSGGVSATSVAFSVVPAAAAAVELLSVPGTTAAGAAITPAPQVRVRDAYGNTVTSSATVTVSIAANPSSGTLSGTTSVAAVNGVAAFPGLSIDKAGSAYALAIAVAGLPAATTGGFDVVPGPVARLAFETQPGASVAGGSIAGPPAVRLYDAYGNATSSADAVTIALGANPGGDTLGGTLTVNAVAGLATFNGLVLDAAAAGYTLTATSGALGAASAAFTVTPGAAAALELLTAPGATPAHAPLAPVPSVRVRDAYGNTVTSSTATVTLALGTNPSSGTLSGTTSVAAVNGVATFPGLSIDTMGAGYTVTASATGLTAATSGAFDVGAGAPATLAFVAQPTDVQAGATLPAVTVEILDAWGNRTTATSEVILGFASAPGGATLSGTKRVAAVNGLATFSDLAIDAGGTDYALSALVDSLPMTVSDPFDVAAAPAKKDSGGCGCNGGNANELALLLGLGALWRAAVSPRRRKAA